MQFCGAKPYKTCYNSTWQKNNERTFAPVKFEMILYAFALFLPFLKIAVTGTSEIWLVCARYSPTAPAKTHLHNKLNFEGFRGHKKIIGNSSELLRAVIFILQKIFKLV